MGIYIIQVDNDGPIKIGFTVREPHKRMAAIKTSNHAELKLLAFIEGSKDLEKRLHRKFAAARRRGEWFDPTPDLLAFIETLPKPPKRQSKRKEIKVRAPWSSLTEAEHIAAKNIWFDTGIQTDGEAAKIIGLARVTVKNNLGPSGRDIRNIKGAERAREMQIASAEARRANKEKGRMPKREALSFWRNPDLTNKEALAQMRGWTAKDAYKELQNRGVGTGRPRKQ